MYVASANGVPNDLMKDDSEYIAGTLGLTLEDNLVNYIVPASPAHLEGSVQIGDRVVAGMGWSSLCLILTWLRGPVASCVQYLLALACIISILRRAWG